MTDSDKLPKSERFKRDFKKVIQTTTSACNSSEIDTGDGDYEKAAWKAKKAELKFLKRWTPKDNPKPLPIPRYVDDEATQAGKELYALEKSEIAASKSCGKDRPIAIAKGIEILAEYPSCRVDSCGRDIWCENGETPFEAFAVDDVKKLLALGWRYCEQKMDWRFDISP